MPGITIFYGAAGAGIKMTNPCLNLNNNLRSKKSINLKGDGNFEDLLGLLL